ncbi:hypothetical protein Nepgr_021707 [Nepenthes gracilis]|uniref:Uncharacterized protein n=1 Tax=Nepenthes gracilis TaxID=150966 RepID=A0AAD3T1C6_NEPGR|nr:hypothetical protein Nepgr_021707 [Nepenthes gracilis]
MEIVDSSFCAFLDAAEIRGRASWPVIAPASAEEEADDVFFVKWKRECERCLKALNHAIKGPRLAEGPLNPPGLFQISNSDESVIPRPHVDIISSLPNSHEAVMDPLGRLPSADLVGECYEVLVPREKDEVKTFSGSSLHLCASLEVDHVDSALVAPSVKPAPTIVRTVKEIEELNHKDWKRPRLKRRKEPERSNNYSGASARY